MHAARSLPGKGEHANLYQNSCQCFSYLGEVCTKSPLTIALSSRSMPFCSEQHKNTRNANKPS